MGDGRPLGPGQGVGRRDARFAAITPPKRPLTTLRRFAKWFRLESRALLAVLLLVLVDGLVALLVPWLVGRVIDSLTNGTSFLIGALFIGYLLDAALSATQVWLMAGAAQRIVAGLRRSLFAKLEKLPLAFFDVRSDGDVMSRFTNDVDNVNSAIAQSTTQLLTALVAIVGSLTLMLVLSPLLTLAALLGAPLVFLLSRTITGRTRSLFQEQQRYLGALNGHVEETITGFDVIKAFHRENKAVEDFESLNAKLVAVAVRAQTWAGLAMPLTNVIGNLSFVAVGVTGGWLALHGTISVGLIASFLGYSRLFVRPLNDIATVWNSLQSALAGAERVFEVLDETEEESDAQEAVVRSGGSGDIEFCNVYFGYRPDTPVLNDVTFRVPAGETLALVGPTGAGKTTIVNLLTRFYEVNSGSIQLDGVDIRSYTRSSLRRAFGVVLQDTFLFSGTVSDNLRYGCPDAAYDRIVQAAVLANADPFIRRLPHGYETVLSEGGTNLSQGQRQLLAIARVVLMDPSLLILDEATSNVDTRTERHLQDAMLALRENRTSFVIAHRLATIREAHTILVVNRGQVAEIGNHDELMKKDGVYRKLYLSQTSG